MSGHFARPASFSDAWAQTNISIALGVVFSSTSRESDDKFFQKLHSIIRESNAMKRGATCDREALPVFIDSFFFQWKR